MKSESLTNNNIYISVNDVKRAGKGICRNNDCILAHVGNISWKGKELGEYDASKIIREIRNKRFKEVLETIDGHFKLLFINEAQEKIIVATDRNYTYPCYFGDFDIGLVITPEILSLNRYVDFELNETSVYEYLLSGHLWGNNTFAKGVTKLGPGQFVDIRNDAVGEEKFWYKMEYNNSNLRKEEGVNKLYSSIKEDVSKIPRKSIVLTLSGGLDSRALLGFLSQLDYSFDALSYTYGTPTEKSSDVEVAKHYANKIGANYKIYSPKLDNNNLIDNIDEVIKATGGESDVSVAQEAFLRRNFYSSLSDNYEYLLRGDEI
jgi:asparagine synthetase B (glutamine-hydrolysing)